MKRRVLIIGILLLSGCGLLEGPVGATATGASALLLINTGKTMSDHAVSFVMDEDCSVVNYEKRGHYCIPNPEEVVREEPEMYCYRTLAQVECHTRAEPYGNKETLVGIRRAWPKKPAE